MKFVRAFFTLYFISAAMLAGLTDASVEHQGKYSLKIRSGNHPRYQRIVFEGNEAIISKAAATRNNHDITVQFSNTPFIIDELNPAVDYQIVDNTLVFQQKERTRIKSFFLSKPDRFVIDIYRRRNAAAKKYSSDKKKLEVPEDKNRIENKSVSKPEQTQNAADAGIAADVSGKGQVPPNGPAPEQVSDDPVEQISDYIPEELGQYWTRLQSGKPYVVIKELATYKPDNDALLAAYHYMYAEAYSTLEKRFKAIEQYRLAYIYGAGYLKELALFKRANLYLKTGFVYESRADYLVFTKNYPSSGHIEEAYLGLGKSLSKIGYYGKAVRSLEKAGESADALYNMANALQRKEKVEEAKRVYDKAMRLDKDYPLSSPETYYLIGENLRMRGEFDAALEYLSSIELLPFKDDASISMGLIFMENAMIDQAIKKFKSAAESRDETKRPKALFNLSLTYMAKQEIDKSISYLETLRKDHPNSALYKDTLLLLGQLYRKQGRINESVSMLKELVYNNKPPRESFIELEKIMLEASRQSGTENSEQIDFGDLWKEVGQWLIDETREDFLLEIAGSLRHKVKPYIDLCTWLVENASAKGRARAAVDLARYYMDIGNVDMARKYINTANVANAVNVAAEFKRTKDSILRIEARINKALGDNKAAAGKIMQVNNLQEGDLIMLGNIINDMNDEEPGDVDRVFAFYERSINSSGWGAEVYVSLADHLYARNETARAFKYYKIAHQKDPDDEWAAYRVGRGLEMPESGNMFTKLEKGDSLFGRLAKTRLREIDLLNKVEEVY